MSSWSDWSKFGDNELIVFVGNIPEWYQAGVSAMFSVVLPIEISLMLYSCAFNNAIQRFAKRVLIKVKKGTISNFCFNIS